MTHAPRFVGRMLTLALLGTMVAGSTLLADDAKKVEGDLKAMQGSWVRDGEDGPDAKLTFDGDKLTVSVEGTDYVCMIKVDSKAMPLPAVDLEVKEGPAEATGKKSKGIYKLDGKKLLLRVSLPGVETRPSELKADDPDSFLFTLKKEEK